MPPKANTTDAKMRRLTDFWVKKDGDSSPGAPSGSQSSLQPSQSSSPSRNAVAKAGGPSFPSSKMSLPFTVGPSGRDGVSLTPNKNASSSPMKPGPSPRKFIVIEDEEDEDDEVMEILAPPSKKRPRETAPKSDAATTTAVSSRSRTPDTSKSHIIDLTRSPPKKRRATDALVSQTGPSGEKSQPVPTALSRDNAHVSVHKSRPSESSNLSFISEDVNLSLEVQSEAPKTASESPTTSSSSSVSLPTNETTNKISNTPQEETAEEKARNYIEEIKRKAMMQRQAKASASVSLATADLEISEEEDEFDKVFAAKKKSPSPPKKAVKPAAHTKSSKVTPGPFSSPLSELTSEEEPVAKKSSRLDPPVPKRQTRASSKAPDLPPPKPLKAPVNKQPIAPARPKSTMPSSLADILGEKPKADKSKEKKYAKFLEEVEEDMKEINRRRVFGDSEDEVPVGDAMVVDPSVTEMALGEEDARRMNDVFASDRLAVVNNSPWRPFWNEQLVGALDVSMQTEYKIPSLLSVGDGHAMVSILKQITTDNDYLRLSTFLGCGMISTIPVGIVCRDVAPWLFALACSSETPSEIALLAELSLSNAFSALSSIGIRTSPITYSQIISAILCLGPLTEALACLTHFPPAVSPPHDPITRNLAVTALIRTLRSAAKTKLSLPEPENVALLLLLLYLDPSTSAELRRDVSLTLEDILVSISLGADDEKVKELDVCKYLVATTTKFRLVEKEALLDCVFGGQLSSRRFMRWMASGLLLPETVKDIDWVTYQQPPSLSLFAEMLDLSSNPGSPYRIWSKTNYEDLLHNVEILGTLLTDVRMFSPTQDPCIDQILSGLDTVHGRIADARAAFLDRTRAKDALQRLKLRVHFQYKHTGKATIDQLLRHE